MNMKPRDDDEGVAMTKTSMDLTYPNMTQDEPERVMNLNRDASSWAKVLPTAVLTGSAQQALSVLTMALADIQKLAKALSVSHAQIEFMATVAKQEIAKADSERDSSQASLLRVREEALEEAATFLEENDGRGTPRQFAQAIRAMKARTALSPHKET